MKPTFEYLITTVNKTLDEIKNLIIKSNVKGRILIGNQQSFEESQTDFELNGSFVSVFNMRSKGVSKNRNFLLNKSIGDFVTFLDDDMSFFENSQTVVEKNVSQNLKFNAVRFNVKTDNRKRKIKQIRNKKSLSFKDLSSYGVWGIFFKRDYLIKNDIYFREDVGPGTEINHGEDGVFLKTFLDFSKILQIPKCAFVVSQNESTWHGQERDLEKELISHGYVYSILFGEKAFKKSKIFLLTHRWCYPKSVKLWELRRWMRLGILKERKRNLKLDDVKVVVLGPIVNDKLSGGVGVFDESLYRGFESIGIKSHIISLAKSSSVNNIVVGDGRNKVKKIGLYFRKIAKEIKKIKPDIVISSTQYSMGIQTYKKIYRNALYIQVLHGVAWPSNGKFKAWAVNTVAKYSRKTFDYLSTVSYLSYALNLQYNGIKCDKVIHNGCNMPLVNESTKDIDFLYVGRLYKDKQVEMIADAFVQLAKNNSSIKCVIAGYGDLESLFVNGKYKNSSINYLGRLTQKETQELMLRSKFFISMHPFETFGTVFNEAALNGCNIVTQSTTGVIPLYMKKKYYHNVDSENAAELCKELLDIKNNYYLIEEDEKIRLKKYLSYDRVAKDYLSFLKK